MKDKLRHYLLGHDEIDKDHVLILTILDTLKRNALGHYTSTKEILKTLEFLKIRTQMHFQYEENIMDSNHYSASVYHKTSHKMVVWFYNRAEKDPSAYSIDDVINDIMRHIDSYDRELVKWMKENNITEQNEV